MTYIFQIHSNDFMLRRKKQLFRKIEQLQVRQKLITMSNHKKLTWMMQLGVIGSFLMVLLTENLYQSIFVCLEIFFLILFELKLRLKILHMMGWGVIPDKIKAQDFVSLTTKIIQDQTTPSKDDTEHELFLNHAQEIILNLIKQSPLGVIDLYALTQIKSVFEDFERIDRETIEMKKTGLSLGVYKIKKFLHWGFYLPRTYFSDGEAKIITKPSKNLSTLDYDGPTEAYLDTERLLRDVEALRNKRKIVESLDIQHNQNIDGLRVKTPIPKKRM